MQEVYPSYEDFPVWEQNIFFVVIFRQLVQQLVRSQLAKLITVCKYPTILSSFLACFEIFNRFKGFYFAAKI